MFKSIKQFISELKKNPKKKQELEKALKDKVLSKHFAFWCDINDEQIDEFEALDLRNLNKTLYSDSINVLTFGYAGQYYGVILDNNESGYDKGTAHYGYKEDGSKNYYKKITFERMVELIKLKDEMLNKPTKK